ncbi:methyl-accepting chemotaxis protein [Rhodoferax aquaticus]|uniref:Methyl-accepting chemotaxis protein n=1 Tax=Rhodoferax aquaticus TaxID=2527691 RepID=A0A515ER06_9BURK|nr:methyl-accepting chemotaxis protein [Rhodoferax aquaticus]QDL55094.1 methyl-accepting chemotaxis protein [Rhodoferax aquaticus]
MKTKFSLSNASVATRISVLGSTGIAVVLLAICTWMTVIQTGTARVDRVQDAGDKAGALVATIDSFDLASRSLLDRTFKAFRAEFAVTLTLNEAQTELKSAGVTLNGDFTAVDNLFKTTGSVGTVFAKKGDDFLRITTSLKKENGERAMGTVLDKSGAAYAALSAGQPFVGRALLFGKYYLTRYEPVKDEAGHIVGALFIGYDLTAFQGALEKMVNEVHLYGSGGLYVIDPKKGWGDAQFVFHPRQQGKKVLEAYPGLAQQLETMGNASESTATPSANVFATKGDDHWAVVRKSTATGWWVVAEVSDREAMAAHWAAIVPVWLMLGGAALSLGLGLFLMTRHLVSRPLQELSTVINRVSEGDLSQSAYSDRKDEIGALMGCVERMRMDLNSLFAYVRESSDNIYIASSEVAVGSADLSGRTERTASNLQQTAASVEQLTGTLQQTAESTRQANALAHSAQSEAVHGGALVNGVIAAMTDINQSSQQISEIIAVIDNIAFQTNILALNAAVEAARAGDHGRGFSVVATEVRNLASQSASAAKDIKTLINSSVERVQQGFTIANESGDAMQNLMQSIKRVNSLIQGISTATVEQTLAVQQVNQAVGHIDQATQENAALVEESAAAAESLKQQAERVTSLINTLKLDRKLDLIAA